MESEGKQCVNRFLSLDKLSLEVRGVMFQGRSGPEVLCCDNSLIERLAKGGDMMEL